MSVSRVLAIQPSKVTPEPFVEIKRIKLLRLIARLLPLRHRLFPLVRSYTLKNRLLVVRWGNYRLCFPGDWPVFAVSGLVFEGLNLNPEFALLRELLPRLRNGAIVDVGANIGCYVLEIRRHSSNSIVAYEPAPAIVELLQKNIELNSLENIDVRNLACGDRRGFLHLDAGINSSVLSDGTESATKVRVPVVTLDGDLSNASKIALLKIDCEGFEYQVLRGAEELLKRDRPALLIELHPNYIGQYGFTPQDLCEFLRPMYDMNFYDFSPHPNRSRAIRFLNRYARNRRYRFTSETEMLNRISREPRPNQIFIVAYPKKHARPPERSEYYVNRVH